MFWTRVFQTLLVIITTGLTASVIFLWIADRKRV